MPAKKTTAKSEKTEKVTAKKVPATAAAAAKKAEKTEVKKAPKAAKAEKPVVAKVEKEEVVSAKSLSELKAKAAPKPEKTEKSTSATHAKGTFFYANGKRKTAVARVRLIANGIGTVTVNDKKIEEYFPLPVKRESLRAPLRITGHLKSFDVSARVNGGGILAQADAIRHGIAKALLEFDPSLRITLKRAGFLTRDPRMKERKKYGLHRARRAPQWSKR